MNKRTIGLTCLLLFLALHLAAAAVGVGISPASGLFEFNKSGGNIRLAVFNGGDDEMLFNMTFSDEAADFASLDQQSQLIPAQGTAFFTIHIVPNLQAQFDREYTLRTHIEGQPKQAGAGVGVTVAPSGSNIYTVVFRQEGTGPVAYQREATSIETSLKSMSTQDWITVAIVSAGVAAVALMLRKS